MRILGSLLDLVVGVRCLACGEPGTGWCARCVTAAEYLTHRETPAGQRVFAAARYDDAVRSAVIAHKERGQLVLVRPLGLLLATAVSAAVMGDCPAGDGGDLLLVPVPSRPSAVRSRGHDHAARLARRAGVVLGCRSAGLLRWGRGVADQAGLSSGQRQANVAGAMLAATPRGYRGTAGPTVVVVDDVLTTGATVDEAVRALSAAGWRVGGAAVVASVEVRRALAREELLR